jgi:hypothetical protein
MQLIECLLPEGDHDPRLVDAFLIQRQHFGAEGPQGRKPDWPSVTSAMRWLVRLNTWPNANSSSSVLGGEVGLQGAVGEACLHGDFPHGGAFNPMRAMIRQVASTSSRRRSSWSTIFGTAAAPRKYFRPNPCDSSYVLLILYIYRK